MHNQETVLNPIPVPSSLPPKHDTTRSWRVACDILIVVFALIGGVTGYSVMYSNTVHGDSQTQIRRFETSLNDYIRAATQAGIGRISLVDIDRSYPEIMPIAAVGDESAELAQSVNALSTENQKIAKAKLNQTIAEYNLARSSNQSDLMVHSAQSLAALSKQWEPKNTGVAVTKSLAVAAGSAIGAAIIAWLVALTLGLIWWFTMDRIRDIARALRG